MHARRAAGYDLSQRKRRSLGRSCQDAHSENSNKRSFGILCPAVLTIARQRSLLNLSVMLFAEVVTKRVSRTRFGASEVTVKQLDLRVFNAWKKLSAAQ